MATFNKYTNILFMVYPLSQEARDACYGNKIYWFNRLFVYYEKAQEALEGMKEVTGITGEQDFCIVAMVKLNKKSRNIAEREIKKLVKGQGRMETIQAGLEREAEELRNTQITKGRKRNAT